MSELWSEEATANMVALRQYEENKAFHHTVCVGVWPSLRDWGKSVKREVELEFMWGDDCTLFSVVLNEETARRLAERIGVVMVASDMAVTQWEGIHDEREARRGVGD